MNVLKNIEILTDIESNTKQYEFALSLANLYCVFQISLFEGWACRYLKIDNKEEINPNAIFNDNRLKSVSLISIHHVPDEELYIVR